MNSLQALIPGMMPNAQGIFPLAGLEGLFSGNPAQTPQGQGELFEAVMGLALALKDFGGPMPQNQMPQGQPMTPGFSDPMTMDLMANGDLPGQIEALIAEHPATTAQPDMRAMLERLADAAAVQADPATEATTDNPLLASLSAALAPQPLQATTTGSPAHHVELPATSQAPVKLPESILLRAIPANGAPTRTDVPRVYNIQELAHRIESMLGQSPTLKANEQAAMLTREGGPAGLTIAQGAQAGLMSGLRSALNAALPTDGEAKALDEERPTVMPMVEWSPRPVREADGSMRRPHLMEQVRQISDFLAERAEGVIKVGEKSVEANMRLYPPDLGGMRVSMSVDSNQMVRAELVVQNPETARLIEQQAHQLRDALSRMGLTVESLRVSVVPAATSNAPGSNMNNNSQTQSQQQDLQREDTAQQSPERQDRHDRRQQHNPFEEQA